jgi:mannose-1-phosphate guanylyltransferase / phosphomannomutase
VWIDEGARIESGVTIGDKVVIGPNVTLREGAHIGDYTVLGDNCVIGTQASVSHSILWSDTFVGRHSTVAGAVLCRRVDIRAGAAVDMNSVIGDESMVGHGARVGANVQVFPYKKIDAAAVVTSSIIWESTGSKSLFGEEGISGLVGVDITPERSMRAAQAFGSMLPKGSHVVVSRDASRGARMVKRAMVAGLNASGCHVRDLRVASPALTRFTARDTRCVAGIHVAASAEDPQSLRMSFYDRSGLDIAPWEEKKLERLYFKGEFRRAFLDDLGEIIYPPRALEYYTAGLGKALEGSLPTEGAWIKVVADLGFGVASLVLPRVASAWRVNVIALNPFVDAERMAPTVDADGGWEEMRGALDLFRADIGVRFDPTAERITFMTASGKVLDGDTALHAIVELWCRADRDRQADRRTAHCVAGDRGDRRPYRPHRAEARTQPPLARSARTRGDHRLCRLGTGRVHLPEVPRRVRRCDIGGDGRQHARVHGDGARRDRRRPSRVLQESDLGLLSGASQGCCDEGGLGGLGRV